jgi:hypothetical protein
MARMESGESPETLLFLRMELSIRVSGILIPMSVMAEASRFGLMAVFMKDIGLGIRLMAEADSYMLMGMFMKAIGLMTRQKVMEFTLIWMGRNTKVTGKKINSMGRVKSLGQTLPCMRETMLMAKNMELVSSDGLMALPIMDSFTIITFMELGRISGQMAESSTEVGETIKCMVKVYLNGVMVANMKGSMKTIRNKVMALSNGIISFSNFL